MPTILVTGFQPFGGEKINPAWEAIRVLPDSIVGSKVVKLQIPVVFGIGADVVSTAIDHINPDIVLCVGQAGGRAKITPEFVGINYRDARIPDNDGNQPHAQRIVEDGPDAYFATLPVRAMTEAMNESGIPAALSYTAGTYVCNDVMYSMLHVLATKYPNARGAFMHVPFATEQATKQPVNTASLPIEVMAHGLEVALAVAVKHKIDVTSESTGTIY
ncbi:pyroglutamyl-peptidase I [Lancefieldella parvula]|uniref:pyroglutamyl-peptidase I n=1 Tax=Lancefieldella parvula TaxID=1382 RepID=UPI0028EA5F55|nr:pyroglutamyl-peptidase I [Lancefieldella parvula]